MNQAVFLDRDGTIVPEMGYVTKPSQVSLLPNAAAGMRLLRDLGYRLIVVTNQAAIAKGLMTLRDLAAVNRRIRTLLQHHNIRWDALYFCPHHPEGTVKRYAIRCRCRKPQPGMLRRAAREHRLDLRRSVVIGDSIRDLQMGRSVGATTILVRTGHRERGARKRADYTACDLLEAAQWMQE